MNKEKVVDLLLSGRRVLVVKFVSHKFKQIVKKSGAVVGVVNLYEVSMGDGKAPTVQLWCPRGMETVEAAQAAVPCIFKEGEKLAVQFDLMREDKYDAQNGVMVQATSVESLLTE